MWYASNDVVCDFFNQWQAVNHKGNQSVTHDGLVCIQHTWNSLCNPHSLGYLAFCIGFHLDPNYVFHCVLNQDMTSINAQVNGIFCLVVDGQKM
jgi:hypothetical protein